MRPLNYVVLHYGGRDVPIFARRGDNHSQLLQQYAGYPARHVVSAGTVDFSQATRRCPPLCEGRGLFLDGEHFISRPSRGLVDVDLLKAQLVLPETVAA
jgi:hypothetical protein